MAEANWKEKLRKLQTDTKETVGKYRREQREEDLEREMIEIDPNDDPQVKIEKWIRIQH